MAGSVNLESLLNLPPSVRRALLIAGDTLAVLIAVWASFAIRLGDWWPAMLQGVIWLFPLAVGILIGLVTLAIRSFSLFTEGIMFAILIANTFAPLIDRQVKLMSSKKKVTA